MPGARIENAAMVIAARDHIADFVPSYETECVIVVKIAHACDRIAAFRGKGGFVVEMEQAGTPVAIDPFLGDQTQQGGPRVERQGP